MDDVGRRPRLAMLAIYVVGMTAYIYAFLHRPEPDYSQELGVGLVVVIALVTVLHCALGVIWGWTGVLLGVLPIVIAIPAGEYPGGWPELPVVFTVFMQELFIGIPLIGLGAVLRRPVAIRRRA